MSHQVNDEWADRASDLMPYLTAGEALDLTGAYEAFGEFPELVTKLEAKYDAEIQKVHQQAVRASKMWDEPNPLINQEAVMEAIRNIESNKRGEE